MKFASKFIILFILFIYLCLRMREALKASSTSGRQVEECYHEDMNMCQNSNYPFVTDTCSVSVTHDNDTPLYHLTQSPQIISQSLQIISLYRFLNFLFLYSSYKQHHSLITWSFKFDPIKFYFYVG